MSSVQVKSEGGHSPSLSVTVGQRGQFPGKGLKATLDAGAAHHVRREPPKVRASGSAE